MKKQQETAPDRVGVERITEVYSFTLCFGAPPLGVALALGVGVVHGTVEPRGKHTTASTHPPTHPPGRDDLPSAHQQTITTMSTAMTTEALEQNGQAVATPVADPLQQINQANLQLASILEVVLKDVKQRASLLGAIDRQRPVEEGETKSSEVWLQVVADLFEVKRVATDALVSRAVGGQ